PWRKVARGGNRRWKDRSGRGGPPEAGRDPLLGRRAPRRGRRAARRRGSREPLVADQRFVQGKELLVRHDRRERLGPLLRGVSELAAQPGIPSKLDERRRQRLDIIGFDQPPALAVDDDRRDPPHGGRDDRQPERHRLDDDASHALVPGGYDHDVGGNQVRRHVGRLARQHYPVGHTQRPGERFETRPLWSIADEQNARRGYLGADARERTYQKVEALDPD